MSWARRSDLRLDERIQKTTQIVEKMRELDVAKTGINSAIETDYRNGDIIGARSSSAKITIVEAEKCSRI